MTGPDPWPHVDVRWQLRDVVLGSAIVFGSFAAYVLLITSIGIAFDVIEPTPLMTIVAAASEGVIIFVVWRQAVRRYTKGGWAAIGIRFPVNARTMLVVPLILLGSLGFGALYEAVVNALGADVLVSERPPPEMIGQGVSRVMVGAALAGWVPFVEELFFRGFVFIGLAARFGLIIGLGASAAMFALAHISVSTMIPIFVTGLLFAWAYWRTQTLWVPITAHACQNLLAVLLTDAT